MIATAMALGAGARLGPYEVLELVGAGGMGEVYRARDGKLDREVALKVLPPGLLADEEARGRFRREAQALSRLSHPHIATLLDCDTAVGVDFLVMELVTGSSLDELLRRGPLPERDVVRLGAQLARGLQAAHERGVVHRDLKPANLRLTPDGLLKILDFGLARFAKPAKDESESTSTRTADGRVVGTPAYMAPEQLLGRGVDARTDLYAAGAVLYELATGRRPHGERAGVELFDAILHREVEPPRSQDASISPGLETVIVKLLDKDPELRYQAARELVVDLERLREPSARSTSLRAAAVAPAAPVPAGHGRAWWMLAAGIACLVLAGAWLLKPPSPPKVREIRRITAGIGGALMGGNGNWATVVSDGERAYYIANKGGVQGLWQVPVAGGDPAPIPLPFAGAPLFAYLRSRSALLMAGGATPEDFDEDGLSLWLVPVPAGSSRRLGLHAWTAAVSPDEKQLAYMVAGALWLAAVDGSNARELVKLPSLAGGLSWSPDGRRLRVSTAGADHRAWVWETPLDRPSLKPLWPGQQGSWVADRGLYVFTRRGGVSGFGLTMSTTGSDVFAVAEGRWPWPRPVPARLTFGPVRFLSPVASRPGGPILVWGEISNAELRRLDRHSGRFEPLLEGTSAAYVDFSADGRWVAWVGYPEGVLWRARPDGSGRVPLTAAPLEVHQPRFSPDGRRLAFVARTPEQPFRSLYVVPADGTAGGKPSRLAAPQLQLHECSDPCWAPDGQSILFDHWPANQMTTGTPGLYRVALAGGPPVREPGTESLELPACSAQGHVLTTDTGAMGAEVVRWAGRSDWQRVGPIGLVSPTWTRDGRSVCGLAFRETGIREVRCYSFDRRRLETVAKLELSLLSVANMPWLFLDPADTPVVVRDSTRDIYALELEGP